MGWSFDRTQTVHKLELDIGLYDCERIASVKRKQLKRGRDEESTDFQVTYLYSPELALMYPPFDQSAFCCSIRTQINPHNNSITVKCFGCCSDRSLDILLGGNGRLLSDTITGCPRVGDLADLHTSKRTWQNGWQSRATSTVVGFTVMTSKQHREAGERRTELQDKKN